VKNEEIKKNIFCIKNWGLIGHASLFNGKNNNTDKNSTGKQ
jgi:hypothetical protein